MKKIVCAIEQEIKFMNDSEEGAQQYRKGYIGALAIIVEFLSMQDRDTHFGEVNSPAVGRLLSSLSLQGEGVLFGSQTRGAIDGCGQNRCTEEGEVNKRKRRSSTEQSCQRGRTGKPSVSVPDFRLNNFVTSRETKALEIALGVLRSDTDYADFLNAWLHDYGRQILSPNPPPPLFPEISSEAEHAVEEGPIYIN